MQYEFKDVLIGFRNEYLKVKMMLDDILKDVKILDQELSKCYVLLDDDSKMISFYFKERRKNIVQKLISVEKELGYPCFHLENVYYNTSVNSVFHLRNDLSHFHIMIENISEFSEKLLYILGSNYINSIKSKTKSLYNNKEYLLTACYNSLEEEVTRGKQNINNITYYPNEDLVKFEGIGVLTNEILNTDLLKVKYDRSLFNEYQQKIIEDADPFNKNIELYKDYEFNKSFNIEEDNKKLILINKSN